MNLKCDILVSKFTFKSNVYRHTKAAAAKQSSEVLLGAVANMVAAKRAAAKMVNQQMARKAMEKAAKELKKAEEATAKVGLCGASSVEWWRLQKKSKKEKSLLAASAIA